MQNNKKNTQNKPSTKATAQTANTTTAPKQAPQQATAPAALSPQPTAILKPLPINCLQFFSKAPIGAAFNYTGNGHIWHFAGNYTAQTFTPQAKQAILALATKLNYSPQQIAQIAIALSAKALNKYLQSGAICSIQISNSAKRGAQNICSLQKIDSTYLILPQTASAN
jgi:hypothetical protein